MTRQLTMESTIKTPTRRNAPTTRDQRMMAWGVIWISFALFCVSAALLTIGIHYFIFQSTIPLSGSIQVSRGTASLLGSDLIEQAVRGERGLEQSTAVTTDPQSQAMLLFRDPYEDGALLATVTLKNGASAIMRQFARPRFNWSSAPYQIVLDDVRGDLGVTLSPNAPRDVVVRVSNPTTVLAELKGAGRYSVSANDTQVSIVNQSGQATVTVEGQGAYPIPVGQQGAVQLGEAGRFAYAPSVINLLGDPAFGDENVVDFNEAPADPNMLVWRCNSVQNSPPNGSYGFALADGLPALRLLRTDGADSHGETLCVQAFNAAEGLDLTQFRHVSIRARFKIDGHSLSVCGVDGSECPLMLRMEYRAAGHDRISTWVHGFFTNILPGFDYPLQCDTCGELHEIIYADRWYTYESGNLLTKLPPELRPASILNFKFYASGHQYDVWVREVELLVDQAGVPLARSTAP